MIAKSVIINKINNESQYLDALIQRRNVLKNEIAQLQTQIERKNGAVLSLKEVLDELMSSQEDLKDIKIEEDAKNSD